MSEENELYSKPRFVYTVKNIKNTVLLIHDLTPNGYRLKPDTECALHELFSWDQLQNSRGLKYAIENNLVEVVKKEFFSNQEIRTADPDKKELDALKAQIADLKSFMESKPDQPIITHQTVDVESIKNEFTKEIEDLKNLLKTSQENQPQIQPQSFDSEALSKQIADTINAQVSQLIKSQSTNGEFKLEGYEETKPEDIATSNLVNTYDKMSQSVKLDSKKTVQEDISDSNIDDNADLLSMLP